MSNYYNTNKEEGNTLVKSNTKANKQQDAILLFFKNNININYTPFDIQDNVLPDTPITSIRRAMTNLEQDNKLVKTATMKLGKYGKANHTWIYRWWSI